jgi:hypothetical protein
MPTRTRGRNPVVDSPPSLGTRVNDSRLWDADPDGPSEAKPTPQANRLLRSNVGAVIRNCSQCAQCRTFNRSDEMKSRGSAGGGTAVCGAEDRDPGSGCHDHREPQAGGATRMNSSLDKDGDRLIRQNRREHRPAARHILYQRESPIVAYLLRIGDNPGLCRRVRRRGNRSIHRPLRIGRHPRSR